MTQYEFESRTGITVSPAEFDAINEAYMNCDDCKDVFCAQWAANNAKRIKAYKSQQRKREALNKLRGKVADVISKYDRMWRVWSYYAVAVLKPSEIKLYKKIRGRDLCEVSSVCDVIRHFENWYRETESVYKN